MNQQNEVSRSVFGERLNPFRLPFNDKRLVTKPKGTLFWPAHNGTYRKYPPGHRDRNRKEVKKAMKRQSHIRGFYRLVKALPKTARQEIAKGKKLQEVAAAL